MKKFIVKANKYLNKNVEAYYHQDYVGYNQRGNPDFINHFKNMSCLKSELDLVNDFVTACEIIANDIQKIIENKNEEFVIITIPRSKADKNYKQCQLMFKKVVSGIANKLGLINGTDAIKRVIDTKTTHDWRMENNTGKNPYVGITKDSCYVDESKIFNKNIILVDDIYTEGVNVAEDCLQLLFDFGAKSVILYVVAKTKG